MSASTATLNPSAGNGYSDAIRSLGSGAIR
jgi:hypothetical protein